MYFHVVPRYSKPSHVQPLIRVSNRATSTTRRSAAATWAARHGIRGRASLEAADGDDLLPGPDSDGEGAGTAAQDGLGAIAEPLQTEPR